MRVHEMAYRALIFTLSVSLSNFWNINGKILLASRVSWQYGLFCANVPTRSHVRARISGFS